MRTNKMCAILGNLHRYNELLPLTENRPLATLPFDCKYRLIDFNLSSIVNANINTVFMVFNEGETQSVFDHIGGGKEWNLDSVRNRFFIHVYQDFLKQKAENKHYYDTVIDYLRKSKSEYTVFMGSKMLCNIDLRAVLKIHQMQENDMTVVYKRMPKSQVYSTDIVLDVEEHGKIIGATQAKDAQLTDLVNLSADIYIVQTNRLIEALSQGQNEGVSVNLESFLRSNITNVKSSAYEYTGYLNNIFDINSYYQANMDMLEPQKFSSLLYSSKKIYTKLKNEVPTYYAPTSQVENSQFATGSIIEGTVKNSLVSRHTLISEDATVEDSIIMANNKIGTGALVKYAILDKEVQVAPGVKIIGTKEEPLVIKKQSHVISDIYGGE
ncbi:glucose-1-phosphate adenylyltransferase subunit GlgD [Enterococcus montenegrensis]|uniref:glucose-1-phosphate adenylyltransferase subunit GlgD n=1 Tax=Enterococcus montenegrensis TaxID=3031993 RepID=UPI00249E5AE4|nr:glucose-1-phosphate adenylyltransferase subunit GlgD [Enterococcus montenegrensis]WHA10269.1 glucose-1-phosphate adenylyltransferase subunit GlgD [Enterococcus montenegrensis]